MGQVSGCCIRAWHCATGFIITVLMTEVSSRCYGSSESHRQWETEPLILALVQANTVFASPPPQALGPQPWVLSAPLTLALLGLLGLPS